MHSHGPSVSDQLGLDVKEGPFSQVLASNLVRQQGSMIAVHNNECDMYSRLWVYTPRHEHRHLELCGWQCVFELHEAVLGAVEVIAVGPPEALHRELPDIRQATCGPPADTLNYDTRLIRRMVQNDSTSGWVRLRSAISELRNRF